MTFDPARAIAYPWLIVGAVWIITAVTAKRARLHEPSASRLLHLVYMAAVFGLLFRPHMRVGPLGRSIVSDSASTYLGFTLTVLGVAFAIWARLALGGNWSGTVTLKENHTLVRRGPYRIVRHPIYAGGLVAMLGTAMVYGQVGCFLAVLLAFVGWRLKARREEEFMTQAFGDQYRCYQQEVKQLIPFVL